MNSIYWHDYETWGADARRDRPCQFAGIRTDEALNIIGEPLTLFCKPAPDFLPHPGACRVTGISPQRALREGVSEAEFCSRILAELGEPGTCGSGYNSVRFDDEVTRHLLYRCFHDPYEREWKHGNSRWDLIDLLRTTRALRPEGIQWPEREDGTTSFRLEELTAANGIPHVGAHDALADVQATIAMARLVREKQPKLYDYFYALRNKNRVLALLDMHSHTPVVHVSSRFPASRGCLGIVIPLFRQADNNNGIVVLNLLQDPSAWLDLDAERIREKLYTASADLAEGEERVGLKVLHLNRCPSVAPLNVLNEAICRRYDIDLDVVEERRQAVLATPNLLERLREVFRSAPPEGSTDPDFMLYSGGFFDDHDKRLMQQLHRLRPSELISLSDRFHDPRLPELLFRFRARNYPETLDPAEQQRWQAFCRARLYGEAPAPGPSLSAFHEALEAERATLPAALYQELLDYAATLQAL